MDIKEVSISNKSGSDRELLTNLLDNFTANNFQVLSFSFGHRKNTIPYILLNINDQRGLDYIDKIYTEPSVKTISLFGDSFGFNIIGLYSTADARQDFFEKLGIHLNEIIQGNKNTKTETTISKLIKLTADKVINPPIEYDTSTGIPNELESIYLQEVENSIQGHEASSCIDQIKDFCKFSSKGLTSIKAIDAKIKSLFLHRKPTEKEVIACTEVLQILNNVDKEYYYKIPPQLLELFETNSLKYYQYLDEKAQFKKSDLTESILCYINLEFWSSEEEANILTRIYEKNDLEIKMKQEIEKAKQQNTYKNQPTSASMELTVVDNKNVLLRILDKIVSFIKNFSGNANKERAHN